VHVYSIPIAGSNKLIVSAELSTKAYLDDEIQQLIDQIVESIIQFHSIAPYAISLHAPFSLPQLPDNTLDLTTIKEKFSAGTLESLYCLSLPWRNLER
jgi:hypothetical protein